MQQVLKLPQRGFNASARRTYLPCGAQLSDCGSGVLFIPRHRRLSSTADSLYVLKRYYFSPSLPLKLTIIYDLNYNIPKRACQQKSKAFLYNCANFFGIAVFYGGKGNYAYTLAVFPELGFYKTEPLFRFGFVKLIRFCENNGVGYLHGG